VARALRAAEWPERALSVLAAGAAAVLLLFAVLAGRDAVDAVRALVTGVHGTVEVRDCTLSDAAKDPRFWTSGWNCAGAFTGDDGRVRIDHAEVFLHAGDRPGPAVSGRVSGPGATWVWPDGEIEWVFALALAAGLPVPAWWCLRASIDVLEPVLGWPRPPRAAGRTRRRRRRRR
jgi:hypothetical protein